MSHRMQVCCNRIYYLRTSNKSRKIISAGIVDIQTATFFKFWRNLLTSIFFRCFLDVLWGLYVCHRAIQASPWHSCCNCCITGLLLGRTGSTENFQTNSGCIWSLQLYLFCCNKMHFLVDFHVSSHISGLLYLNLFQGSRPGLWVSHQDGLFGPPMVVNCSKA